MSLIVATVLALAAAGRRAHHARRHASRRAAPGASSVAHVLRAVHRGRVVLLGTRAGGVRFFRSPSRPGRCARCRSCCCLARCSTGYGGSAAAGRCQSWSNDSSSRSHLARIDVAHPVGGGDSPPVKRHSGQPEPRRLVDPSLQREPRDRMRRIRDGTETAAFEDRLEFGSRPTAHHESIVARTFSSLVDQRVRFGQKKLLALRIEFRVLVNVSVPSGQCSCEKRARAAYGPSSPPNRERPESGRPDVEARPRTRQILIGVHRHSRSR